MTIYKLYAAIAATTNAAAQLQINRRGTLFLVQWASFFDATADNSSAIVELSKTSTAQVATNDTAGSISELRHFLNTGAAGQSPGGINLAIPMAAPVAQGDRIYLHGSIVTGAVYVACFLHVAD